MQRRPQPRPSQEACLEAQLLKWGLPVFWRELGNAKPRLLRAIVACIALTLGLSGCMRAQAPAAIAANKDKDSPEAVLEPAPDEDNQEGRDDKANAESNKADKRERPKREDQGLQSVNIATDRSAKSNRTEHSNKANHLALDAKPEVLKEAQARLTQSYQSRLSQLQEQHVKLAQKDKELNSATADLMAKLDDISALEDRLQRELGIGKAQQEYRGQRIKSLSALIMTMPPQSGARILSQMSERDAQEIVLGMAQKSERKAAKILAQMPPDKAAELGRRYLAARKHIKGSDGLFHKSPGAKSDKGDTP